MPGGAGRFSRSWGTALSGSLLLAALAGAPGRARADAAPISGLAGSDVSPVQATSVRLASETVLLELWRLSFGIVTNPDFGERDHLGAKVTADFVLNNPGAAAESMTVGFPLYLSVTAMGQDVGYYDLKNLRAYVNGGEVETRRTTVEGADWAAWEMQFAPGDTQLRVTYDLPATEDGCNAELGYLLHTGALWAGNIGEADVIVRFGYPAEDMFVSPRGGLYLGPTSPGYTVQDFDVRWRFQNFEPDQSDDVAITFVTPSCWRNVLQARQALAADQSAANYWKLAKVLADIVYPHHGFDGPAIAAAADAQYRKAIELDPENEELLQEYDYFLQDQTGYLLLDSAVANGQAVLTQAAPTLEPAVTEQAAIASPEASATIALPATAPLTGLLTDTPAPANTAAAPATEVPASPTPAPSRGGCLPGALSALALVGWGIAGRRRWARGH